MPHPSPRSPNIDFFFLNFEILGNYLITKIIVFKQIIFSVKIDTSFSSYNAGQLSTGQVDFLKNTNIT